MKNLKNTNEEMEQNEMEESVVGSENHDDNKFLSSIKSNQKTIVIISVLVIAIIAGMIYMKTEKEKAENEAGMQLARITTIYQQGDLEKSLAGDPLQKALGLKAIANKYESTDAGKLAALYAGNALLTLNKTSEAIKYFEIAEGSDSKLVQLGATAGMAGCDENNNKWKEAAEKYEKASTLAQDDNTISRYKFYAGLCFEKLSDKANAEKYYRDVIKINRNSEFASQSKMGLTRIGMIIE